MLAQSQFDAWRALGMGDDDATNAFNLERFNNLILVLEQCFVHRMRGNESKDGNPLNEVWMLADSILTNHAVLAADKTVKYKPETAVVGLVVLASQLLAATFVSP